jgi:hypothetical protein
MILLGKDRIMENKILVMDYPRRLMACSVFYFLSARSPSFGFTVIVY